MNFDDIVKAHANDISDPALIGANDCGLLGRESALIAKVRELEKDKAGLVEALGKMKIVPSNVIASYHGTPGETPIDSHTVWAITCRIDDIYSAAIKQHGGEHEIW